MTVQIRLFLKVRFPGCSRAWPPAMELFATEAPAGDEGPSENTSDKAAREKITLEWSKLAGREKFEQKWTQPPSLTHYILSTDITPS